MSVEIKKLIDLTRLSRFKELMDQSVDGKLSKLKIDLVQVVSALPEISAAEEGVLYFVPTGTDGEYDLYAKETVDGTVKFVKNGSISINGDIGDYLLKADADKTYFSNATVTDNTITLTRPDGTSVTITVNTGGAVNTGVTDVAAYITPAPSVTEDTPVVGGLTVTSSDGATKTVSILKVPSAVRDGKGAVIDSSYVRSAEAYTLSSDPSVTETTPVVGGIRLKNGDDSSLGTVSILKVPSAVRDGKGAVIDSTYQKVDDISLASTADIDALFATAGA